MRLRSCHAPATAEGLSDETLMAAIQQQDSFALAVLFDRYGSVLKALALRIVHNEAEAEDLLMEFYVEVWNQAHSYSAAKGRPLGWLVTLARRRAIDRLRKRQSYACAAERFRQEIQVRPDTWTDSSTEGTIEMHELHDTLVRAISQLPFPQQEAIDLAFYRGMSQREIAKHTGIPLGTIKTRLELGLRKVADALRSLRNEL